MLHVIHTCAANNQQFYSLGKMRRLLLWSGLILLALLSCPATAAGLKLYESRVIFFGESPGVQQWEVEGVATVQLDTDGSDSSPVFTFDCNTTANNGAEILWVSEVGQIDQTPLAHGKRLEFGRPRYEDLGVYYCIDRATGDQVALNITDGNPTVSAVEDTKAVVLGQSVELEVYVSGIPPVISSQITWFGPNGNELTESAGTFDDSRQKLMLYNVQNSSSGIYKSQVSIPDYSTAMDAIRLEVYLPSVITQDPQSHIGVEEWSEVILSCTATGHPLPVISWEREGGELPVFSQTSSSESNGMVVSTLTIGTVRYMDMGRYRCSADNTETAVVYSQYAELSVIPSLRLVATVNNIPTQFTNLVFVEEGSSVRVECHGFGTLAWSASTGFNISSDLLNQIYQQPDYSRGVQTLYIQSFSDNALSTYTCTTDLLDSTNNYLQNSVFITNSNPAVYIAEETLYALEDTSVTITANIFAYPAVDSIQWFHKGSLVDPLTDTRFSFGSDQRVLHIHSVDISVLGTYEVVATIGSATARDSIIVAFPEAIPALPTPNGTGSTVSSVNENLYSGVSNCSAGVEECDVMDTNSSFGVKLIVFILAPVGGILLIAIVTVLICSISIHCCCSKKIPKVFLKRSTGSFSRASVSKSDKAGKTVLANDGTRSASASPSDQRASPYASVYYLPDTVATTSGTDSTRYTVLKGPSGPVPALSLPTEREGSSILPSSKHRSERPWYEMDCDFSKLDDINPYATTHNSAIPYDRRTTSGSSSSRFRASSLPCISNKPRRWPVQAAPVWHAKTVSAATAVLSTDC